MARSVGTRSEDSPPAEPKAKRGRKKRRIRSPHPGVVLIPPEPDGRHPHWRARYRDPDTERMTKVRLDPVHITTAEARRDWAIDKSKALAKRRVELESGAARATGTALDDALAIYFKAHPQLGDRTKVVYRMATKKLTKWAAKAGVKSADHLNRARLMAFREVLITAPKRRAVEGGKRGSYASTEKARSPVSVNQDLRSVRTVLGYLRDRDLLPRLSHDDMRRALKRLPVATERIEHLKPAECKKLLEAALRHDADTFAETREEHAGEREKGTTLRYDPIAPFVAFVLMTGMRLGEACELQWSQVELDALDHEGKKVGEIHLAGETVKTKKARTVGLEVSPALHAVLAALKLQKAEDDVSVFGVTDAAASAAAERLRDEYGAPANFSWQMLRRTCGTYLTNAAGIFGAASAYRSAKQLGHSVQVAEKHYVDVLRGIPREARTLEAAMQVEKEMATVLARASGDKAAPILVAI